MAFVIPTVFSAVDRYSQKVVGMVNATNTFGAKLDNVAMRSERAFNKLPNVFGKATKNLLAYGEAALLIEGTLSTGKDILDYQTEIQDLSAVTGAAGSKLEFFKDQIKAVADETRKSMPEVAKAFTTVDNNMPELHENAAGLAEVTKQSIILAQASRMQLQPAAESLTMTLNQFGLKADKAKDVIDALSGGAVAGSSRIAETTEALQKFGAASDQVVGATVNESIALVELASKFEKGSEAGIRARNILLDLSIIKVGPAADLMKPLGVNMDIVSNKALPLIDRLREISKIKGNPEAMEKLFDKRNLVVASGLFSRLDDYDKILKATFKKGGATDMAAKENATFIVSLERLRDKFVNIVISSDKVNGSLSLLNGTVKFMTDHLDGILSLAEPFILFVGAWWGFNKVLGVVTASYYVWSAAIGVNTFLQGASLIALGRNTGALAGYSFASEAAAIATDVFNTSLVGLAATVTVVTGGLALIIAYHKEIAGWANNSKAGIAYNDLIGDNEAVRNALVSNYKDDPAATKKYIEAHPKYNTPAIQAAFADEDMKEGLDNLHKKDSDNSTESDLHRRYKEQHNGQEPGNGDTAINLYFHVDRNGNITADAKNSGGAVPVNIHQTGTYNK